ncbi:phosphate acetyl/butaryl transferase [Lucifera butyrica]|uniref:Phosphate acetyl/butaryl transferase n=1 Tax=Lucifera butyrica TaxID=1351585 RepID=A0A498R8X9_9FIRM|nr:bifunctional enoyl-CoA hydratase/phosphate acetyltransferase [Lucifera butyrica]VBB07639.1 phosphate acetyl/butaryl transferase [Lucifera butyrica]
MFRNLAEILTKAQTLGRITVSVAVAQDRDVLEALKAAQDVGLARAILVGDAAAIRPILVSVGLPADTPIVDEPDIPKAALAAVSIVRQGKAQVVMKGKVNSSDFLRAVLNRKEGLRTGRLLSHLAVYEIPGEERLLFLTDGGMNIAPSLPEKKDILVNAMLALNSLGIKIPNVALLTANELVNPKMPATIDAQALADMSAAGKLPPGIVEGPIAMDVAVNPEAAKHKGLTSKVSGRVDLFLAPNIETGNALGKTLIHYGKAKMAGIVLGATHPVIMTSRAETAEGKLNSIALACLVAAGTGKGDD